jgi:nucleoside-diphosphate-sugar epimerase
MSGFKCYLGHREVLVQRKQRKLRVVIVGAGDVAKRLAASSVGNRVHWVALARSSESRDALHHAGIVPIQGDLDSRRSLVRVAAYARTAHAVVYLAPPPNHGDDDPRMRRWLAAMLRKPAYSSRMQKKIATQRNSATQRMRGTHTRKHCVYVSTTGVYGDRAGDWVSEVTTTHATSARSKRRVAAEARLRADRLRRTSILRAPGIYAAERLPIERLHLRTPALLESEDVYTNHIHADDLAKSVWLAIFRGRANRVINVVDDAELKMGEYFDRVALATGLPKPPRLSRALLQREVTPMMYSFMCESRRIRNARLKRELRLQLRYPSPDALLRTMKASAALQQSLL